ncbi:uncharacterized protein LOC116343395 [Contarinia nasturtii]|uniref:uncharacterized protein LOC116343395 n=1 Tax=Contarinia nasturtii TaxID=265458 RepID=UPI0012D3EFBA|nr:uncharacterized protein LOC116343395 [Contarinia nasturtii]
MLSEALKNTLHRVAKDEGFGEYEIETKIGSSHGDNYVGILIAVTISGTKNVNNQSKYEELSLICKTPPVDENRRKILKSNLVFDREIYVYSKLLPAFTSFQQNQGLSEADSFLSFPKVYACEANEKDGNYILIMEDMRSKNYEMWPKEKEISLDHELRIMTELGKFNGVAFAMKTQRPDQFAEFNQMNDLFVDVVSRGLFRSLVLKSIERAANALKNPKYKQFMNNIRSNCEQKLEYYLSGTCNKDFTVIGHSDCWSNNFLFQYFDKNKTQLKSICFLDWQFTHSCSPALDLLYNIFSSTDKNFREKHYEQLLQAYHSSLSTTIEKLGSDPDGLFSYENLQNELKKFGEFTLLVVPMLLLVKITNPKDIKPIGDYSACVERGEEIDLINNLDEETQEKFSGLINDLFDDLVRLGYINI